MFVKVDKDATFSWDDYVFVHPAISVGGVGQLSIDLILNNMPDAEKIGYLHDRCFLPAVGSNPFDQKISKSICTSCEVYESKSLKLIIVQQRSPFIKGRIPAYRRNLIQWIKSCQFKQIVILGSCSAHIQNDMDLKMSVQNVMYLLSKDCKNLEETICTNLKWTKFIHTRPELMVEDLSDDVFIPGGGITKTLIKACCENDIPAVALLVFSSDGNGTPDAITIADGFSNLLPLITTFQSFKQGSWKIPASWNRLLNSVAVLQMY